MADTRTPGWMPSGNPLGIRDAFPNKGVFAELTPPYATIVVDPPWPLTKVPRRVRPNQKTIDYSMMALDDIAALPISGLAAENATLFCWTIDKYLYDTPGIVEAWGFKYHVTMAWDKGNGLSLFGFNRRTEFVIVAFKGPHDAYPDGKVMPTSFAAKSPGHSIKPASFADMVEARFPGPYVELFARQQRFGWDSWGYGYESAAAVADDLKVGRQ